MAGRRYAGSSRPTSWALGPSSFSSAITSSVNTLWTGQIVGGATGTGDNTIIRTRGRIRALLLTSAAAGDGFAYGLGIALVENTALAAGAGSLPGPVTEADWDGWLWHSYGQVQSTTATIADGVNASSASMVHEIDSKAMRKWDVNAMTLVGLIETVELGTAGMELVGHCRVLLKS